MIRISESLAIGILGVRVRVRVTTSEPLVEVEPRLTAKEFLEKLSDLKEALLFWTGYVSLKEDNSKTDVSGQKGKRIFSRVSSTIIFLPTNLVPGAGAEMVSRLLTSLIHSTGPRLSDLQRTTLVAESTEGGIFIL